MLEDGVTIISQVCVWFWGKTLDPRMPAESTTLNGDVGQKKYSQHNLGRCTLKTDSMNKYMTQDAYSSKHACKTSHKGHQPSDEEACTCGETYNTQMSKTVATMNAAQKQPGKRERKERSNPALEG